jgi:hypothetical protein
LKRRLETEAGRVDQKVKAIGYDVIHLLPSIS